MEDQKKIGDEVARILEENNNERSALISILLNIQSKYNYLPKSALKMVADRLNMRLIEVYSVATFYQVFSLKPRGKHIISICMGTACHVRGGRSIVDRISKTLNIGVGETTPDHQFTLETVRCVGACAWGPVIVVNDEYHERVRAAKVDQILQKYSVPGD